MTTSDQPVTVLLISGSTRPGSTNTAALRTAAELEIPGVVATLWERLRDIPAFVPEDPAEAPAAVTELQRLLTEADAVLFCTPEYAGTLPGSLKNAIDWLVGSGELYRKPVAWVTVAHPGRIQHRDRITRQIEMHFKHIPRGAWIRRDDRGLAPGQPIEQRGLSGIGRTRDRNRQALPQPLSPA